MSNIETKENPVLAMKKSIVEKLQSKKGSYDVLTLRILLESEEPRRREFSITLQSLLRDNGIEGINPDDPRYLENLMKVENAERLKFYTALSFLLQEKVIKGVLPDDPEYQRKTEKEAATEIREETRIVALCQRNI